MHSKRIQQALLARLSFLLDPVGDRRLGHRLADTLDTTAHKSHARTVTERESRWVARHNDLPAALAGEPGR